MLAVHDLGGEGAPLVLAHATGFHARALTPLAARLGQGFHSFGFDAPGHGETPAPADRNFDWERASLEVLGVIDDLGIAHPFGFGHSYGGAVLLLAEAARPGTFRALFCFEPVIIPSIVPPGTTFDNPLAAGARRRREVFPSRQAAYDNYASKPPLNVLTPDSLRAYIDYGFDDLPDGTVRLKCRGNDEADTYVMASHHHAFARLPDVHCPVTVACGSETDAFGADAVRTDAERLPHGRAVILPGLNHFGPMQDPDAVAAAITGAFGGENPA
jgi:pimeloyl-ACP methyl ester carboxylesterase